MGSVLGKCSIARLRIFRAAQLTSLSVSCSRKSLSKVPLGSGVIRSASRLRFRFGQVNLNNHSFFGVRRFVATMAPPSKGKRRQVAALHSALVICPSFAHILT